MKVLLIRFSSAGDILLLKNVIDFLNKQRDIKIYLLTKQEYKEIAEILKVKNIIILNSKNTFLNELNRISEAIENAEKFIGNITDIFGTKELFCPLCKGR